MSCEEHTVDALLRMEILERNIVSSNRTWSDYPDALVRTKFVNALQREYNFQKQLLESREGGDTREAFVRMIRDRYELPEFESFRKKKNRPSVDQAFMANGLNFRHGGGRSGGSGRGQAATKAVVVFGAVTETNVEAVTTAGAAAQAAEEPQAHAENLITSATATNTFGVSVQNYCTSAARRRVATSYIARASRTW